MPAPYSSEYHQSCFTSALHQSLHSPSHSSASRLANPSPPSSLSTAPSPLHSCSRQDCISPIMLCTFAVLSSIVHAALPVAMLSPSLLMKSRLVCAFVLETDWRGWMECGMGARARTGGRGNEPERPEVTSFEIVLWLSMSCRLPHSVDGGLKSRSEVLVTDFVSGRRCQPRPLTSSNNLLYLF
jgi:hypothetical protein